MSSLWKTNKRKDVCDAHALGNQSVCVSDYHAWDNGSPLEYQVFGGNPSVSKPSGSTTGSGIFLVDDHSDNYVSFEGIGSLE